MPVRYAPYADPRQRRRPGLAPMDVAEWIEVDAHYAEQMVYRDRLIAEKRNVVFAETEGSRPAQQELLVSLVAHLERMAKFAAAGDAIRRPDGAEVSLAGEPPVLIAGHLVQEDFCIMERVAGEDEYVLTAAILCFPSRWSLAEKIGRPLTAIHDPVPEYDADLAKRVNRVFDGVKADMPLWRANWTVHGFDELHQPSGDWRGQQLGDDLYVRVERQTFVRLPETQAVVFGIRTYVDPLDRLTPQQAAALREEMAKFDEAEMRYHSGLAIHAAALERLAALAV